jgi:hippurate hydrolase
VAAQYPELEKLFLELHAHPELSMQEFKTSDRLAAELKAQGYDVTRKIGVTGLVGVMRNGDGPTVLIRADMDGLPVEEKTGLPYASKARQVNLDGVDMPVMHACGHDVHVTALVGVARELRERKDEWHGTVMLLGQPAEESIGGARAMVDDDLYGRVGRPDYALAFHVIAKYPAGKIAFSDGLMYSSADTVRIKVHGIATHGASPHLGRDPIVVASEIVLALQTIVTREVSPIEPALITVGAFHSGTAPNVISDIAVLDITVRANTEATRALVLESIERVALNTARAAGCRKTSCRR